MSENQNRGLTPGSNIDSMIEEDMKDSYLRYSMSVIISRALPDARDGLKPVHRRVLYGMHDLGVYPGKKYLKSARIVGDVIGKYHPHGDTAVYETLVRMAQEFSLRYPLVDGQGNFGSIDGDSPAAMRYTEARMAKPAELMLEDLGKDTVDFNNNYDDSMREPSVLPSALPNLMVNGTTGIAVGMATSMAPHNLTEITNAIKAYIENPDIADEDLLPFVSGPDFPTGGIICGRSGIRSAYLTGRGKVKVRAKTSIELTSKGRERIIITEIPYMVNKANMIEKVAQLIREKKVEGISDIRDESTKDIRVIIDIKRDAVADVILNQLYKYTQLQDTFSMYNLALVNKQPTVLNLKALIQQYVDHRHDVLVRKTNFELAKAEARAHILEGLKIAQENIDEVIKIIKASSNQADARNNLEERFTLSEKQSEAIVAMRLGQLTALDVDKIIKEFNELIVIIEDLKDILSNQPRRMNIIRTRLEEIEEKFGDARRTQITDDVDDIDFEDLITEEEQVITLSKEGYVKRLGIDTFRAQGRGGRGVNGASLKNEDLIKTMLVASTHDFLLVFTNLGRLHWTKVYRIPEGSRTSRGKAIVNILNLVEGEEVSAIVPVREFNEEHSLMFATKNGTVNKMSLENFSRPRKNGINVITLDEGDELVTVVLAKDDSNVMIASNKGQAICFPPSAFRTMGRGTRGVRGIKLSENDFVVGMALMAEGLKVITITERGFCKRSRPEEYRITNRGGKGIRNVKVTEKNGKAIFVTCIPDDFDVIVTTLNGVVIRFPAESIRVIGRDSQGVKAINLRDGDSVIDATILPAMEDEVEVDSTISTDSVTDETVTDETLAEVNSEAEEILEIDDSDEVNDSLSDLDASEDDEKEGDES